MTFFLALAVGLVFGGLAVWLMLRADAASAYARARGELAAELSALNERLAGHLARIEDLTKDRDHLRSEIEKSRKEAAALLAVKTELETRLAESGKLAAEKLQLLDEAQARLADAFKALSAEALHTNNAAFLNLAQTALEKFHDSARTDLATRQKAIDEMLRPVRESLHLMDRNLNEIEKNRAAAYAGISEQVKGLLDTQNLLRAETSNLVSALRTPAVRGRWGEVQLRRVVEMAGMTAYCHFDEQTTVDTDAGRLRPDLVIHLPNHRQVVVDAKVSLKAYLEAMDSRDEAGRHQKLAEHAAQVRSHLQRLGSKAYWQQFEGSPEFTVAFLPGEAFFSAALEADPDLLDFGVENKVILATPTTLIALLKAVAYGWRQEKLTQNAQEISALGKTLYERLCTFADHMDTLRTNLQRTVESYNRAAGSLESRVLVGARRFRELGAGGDHELTLLEPVDSFPRSLQAVEWAVSGGGAEAGGAPADLAAPVGREPFERDDDPGSVEPDDPRLAGSWSDEEAPHEIEGADEEPVPDAESSSAEGDLTAWSGSGEAGAQETPVAASDTAVAAEKPVLRPDAPPPEDPEDSAAEQEVQTPAPDETAAPVAAALAAVAPVEPQPTPGPAKAPDNEFKINYLAFVKAM